MPSANPVRQPGSTVALAEACLVRFAARTSEQLASEFDRALADPARYWAAPTHFAPGDELRAAFVARQPGELAEQLRLARQHAANPTMRRLLEEQGIFFGEPGRTSARTAVLFPGQGSQYTDMLSELVRQSPGVARRLAEIDGVLGARGWPSFAQMAWGATPHLGVDPWTTQAVMLVADLLVAAALAERGVVAHCFAGHSYGEFPALVAAGACSLEQALELTRARTQCLARSRAAQGSMVSVLASAATTRRLVSTAGLEVTITHYNAPEQTVVGGTRDAIARFAAFAESHSVETRMLSVPGSFHTPLAADVIEDFSVAVSRTGLQPPRTRFVSNVTGRPTSDPRQLGQNLVAQLVEPVRYADMICDLAESGVTVFVESGPQQVLTRLNRQILAGRSVTIVGCDHPTRPTAEVWLRAEAALECAGALNPRQPAPTPVRAIGAKAVHLPGPPVVSFDATAQRRERLRHSANAHQGSAVPGNGARRPDLPHERPAPNGHSNGNGHDHGNGHTNGKGHAGGNGHANGNGHTAKPSPLKSEPRPAADVPRTPATAPQRATNTAELQSFLVNFVVEQTGYPPEVVNLDADLEADLGIDSIKRAQLLGELREFFELPTSGNATLRSFRTLRQIVDLLASVPGKGDWLPPVAEPVHEAPPSVAQPLTVEQPRTSPSERSKLAERLIEFVMENTGYPREVIALDADLESDLGIDSIKKAQLLGELRDELGPAWAPVDRQATGASRLSDIRTLEQILDRVSNVSREVRPAPAALEPAVARNARPAVRCDSLLAADSPARPSITAPSLIRLSGDAYECGFAQGRAEATEIRKLLKLLVATPRSTTSIRQQTPGKLKARSQASQYIQGLAEGAGVAKESLLAWHDWLAAESLGRSDQLASAAADGGPLHALRASLPWGWVVPPLSIRLVQPSAGHKYLLCGFVGQYGGLCGTNAAGITVSVARLTTGLDVVAAGELVQTLLAEADDVATALARLRKRAKVGSGRLLLSDRAGETICRIDYTPRSLDVRLGLDSSSAVPSRRVASEAKRASRSRATSSASSKSTGRLKWIDHDWTEVRELLGDPAALAERKSARASPRCDDDQTRSVASVALRPQIGQWRVWLAAPISGLELPPITFDVERLLAGDGPSDPRTLELETAELTRPAKPEVAARYVLRLAPRPQRANGSPAPQFTGRAVIVGDNDVAKALRTRLTRMRVPVAMLPSDDSDEAIAALEHVWQQGPATHLFLLSPRDREARQVNSPEHWLERRARGVMLPFRVVQRWAGLVGEAGLCDEATLVSCTALGGDFGLSGRVPAPEGGALAGLLKAIAIEWWVAGHRATPVKIIDTPVDEPAADVVAAIFAELAVPSYDMEVAYRRGVRHVVQAVAKPATRLPRCDVARGGVWVCTGGGRGITARVARELAQRYGLRLHLVGTAPVPSIAERWREASPELLREGRGTIIDLARALGRNPLKEWQKFEKALEIDRTLTELAANDIQARYHSCDIADREALATVLDTIRRSDGPIEGILHGAGVGKDARLERKVLDDVEQCIRAKADGALNLMELTRDDPLRWFIGFGSISGRFGANGHSDYSLANDLLCKLVDRFRRERPECASTTFHWHAWGDVGMATKPETRLALEMIDMQFMPADEGVNHLIRELEAGLPEGEVLITDDRYRRMFFPTDGDHSNSTTGSRTSFPLLAGPTEAMTNGSAGSTTFDAPLDPKSDPFLADHRLDDKPLLPIAVGVELLAEAAVRAGIDPARLELRDIEARAGVRFEPDRPQTLRVRVNRTDASSVRCQLAGDFFARNGRLVDPGRVYLEGTVASIDVSSEMPSTAPRVTKQGWEPVRYADQSGKFYLGPTLRCLRNIRIGDDEAHGRIIAPALAELAGTRRACEGWLIPSAVLDACLYATGLLAWERVAPGVALPARFGSLRLGVRLPAHGEECLVASRVRWHRERRAGFDFELFGRDGELLLAAADYQIVWLNSD